MGEFRGTTLSPDTVRAINIGLTTYVDAIQKNPSDDNAAINKSMDSFIVELSPAAIEYLGDSGIATLLWVALIRTRIDIEVVDG